MSAKIEGPQGGFFWLTLYIKVVFVHLTCDR